MDVDAESCGVVAPTGNKKVEGCECHDGAQDSDEQAAGASEKAVLFPVIYVLAGLAIKTMLDAERCDAEE